MWLCGGSTTGVSDFVNYMNAAVIGRSLPNFSSFSIGVRVLDGLHNTCVVISTILEIHLLFFWGGDWVPVGPFLFTARPHAGMGEPLRMMRTAAASRGLTWDFDALANSAIGWSWLSDVFILNILGYKVRVAS